MVRLLRQIMAVINPIIFRLPSGIKDKYDIPEHQGIFDNDGTSDRLFFQVLPEDYNAANPITKEKVSFSYKRSRVKRSHWWIFLKNG